MSCFFISGGHWRPLFQIQEFHSFGSGTSYLIIDKIYVQQGRTIQTISSRETKVSVKEDLITVTTDSQQAKTINNQFSLNMEHNVERNVPVGLQ